MDTLVDGNMSKEEAKKELKPWIRRYGRFGYMAKGSVYLLIGLLALMAALGIGRGKTTDTTGLFRSLAALPLGEALLWVLVIGLVGYVSWSLIKAIKDPHNYGKDAKGIIARVAFIVSAGIYSSIAYNAYTIAVHAGGSSNTEQTMSAKLLSQPFGRWLLVILGLIIIGYGVKELYSGLSGRYMKKFNTAEMNEHECEVAKKSGRMGLSARGVVFGMIGYFFIQTAWTANPSNSKGIDGALAELAQKPFGPILLGIAATGLILYGVFQITRGRYQHMSFGK